MLASFSLGGLQSEGTCIACGAVRASELKPNPGLGLFYLALGLFEFRLRRRFQRYCSQLLFHQKVLVRLAFWPTASLATPFL
jgi:hypothetical protein